MINCLKVISSNPGFGGIGGGSSEATSLVICQSNCNFVEQQILDDFISTLPLNQ
ncbi:hypothetical protein [Mesohalobacter salilacus]|uniref:hypothetical protein n=1 Tax=Mesohalobacter salilacus TaxID=2491711 RepID=UPI0026D3BF67